MTILVGVLGRSGSGGFRSSYVSVGFSEYTGRNCIGWPPGESISAVGYGKYPGKHFPVSGLGKRRSAIFAKAYMHDFYFRVHVIPQKIDLGNISSEQGFDLIVWNAYFEPQKISTVTGVGSGVALTPPRSLPFDLQPLEETLWKGTALADGDPEIDIQVSFNFDDVDSPKAHITGMRVSMWPFLPDWTEPIEERLEWLTDVLTSGTGTEQRRSIRLSPRRYYRAQFLLFKDDRQYFEMSMVHNGAGTWALPLWAEMQETSEALQAGDDAIRCDTVNRELRPESMIVLRAADVNDIFTIETAIIASVFDDHVTLKRPLQKDWPVGTRLYPARSARLHSLPKVEYRSDEVTQTQVHFEVVGGNDWNAQPPAKMYRGFPLFDTRPDESKNLTSEYLRILKTLDNMTGIPAVVDMTGSGFYAQEHAWFLVGTQELSDFKGLLYYLRGRQVPVWVPTHKADLSIARISFGDVLFVKKINYTGFGLNRLGKRDIVIERNDGTSSAHRIVAAMDIGNNIERLSISPELDSELKPEDCARISFMGLCRLNSDSVTLEHVSDITGLTRASVIWRSLKEELEEPQK